MSERPLTPGLIEEALAWVREGLLCGVPDRYLPALAERLGVTVCELAAERDRQRVSREVV